MPVAKYVDVLSDNIQTHSIGRKRKLRYLPITISHIQNKKFEMTKKVRHRLFYIIVLQQTEASFSLGVHTKYTLQYLRQDVSNKLESIINLSIITEIATCLCSHL